MGSNCWKYVYAEPLEDAPPKEAKGVDSPVDPGPNPR
jgi:hypothetical protein